MRGGWSVRQLDRQIATQFFERTQLSRNKAAVLRRGQTPEPSEQLTPEQGIKDPLVLEFLGLNDEYSESAVEEALIHRLEHFLLELGSDFAFIGRQRRLAYAAAHVCFAPGEPRRGHSDDSPAIARTFGCHGNHAIYAHKSRLKAGGSREARRVW